MKDTIRKRCDLLTENWGLVHKAFSLENNLMTIVAAASYVELGKTVDVETLKESHRILKQKQSIFSEFRGSKEVMVAAKMALSGNPEGYIDDVVAVYKKLQNGKFWESPYKAFAAMIIVDAGKTNEADAVIEKTKKIMDGMTKDHPFLTSDEDTSFAVLLAMTDKSVEAILTELEESFQYIKKDFSFHQNAAYSLSQVLTTYPGDAASKKDKALELLKAFEAAGTKYGKDYELASIGSLIDIKLNTNELVDEIIEVADYLKENKGFGSWSISSASRLMFGNLIVSQFYAAGENKAEASVTAGTIAKVVAEEAAMLVAIIAATSASAFSSSASH
ncbi:MAG: DUF4003 domain-containing protein [Butyrivibrio sp.]|nr:DUF4003 domain-containing protein [Butyrivibrio sp.]